MKVAHFGPDVIKSNLYLLPLWTPRSTAKPSPWLQDIHYSQLPWCRISTKLHPQIFLQLPPTSPHPLFFSSSPSVTYKSNLPSCCSCPGILAELFQTFIVSHEIIQRDEKLQSALTPIFQSASSTHLWFSAITQDKVNLLLWIKNSGEDMSKTWKQSINIGSPSKTEGNSILHLSSAVCRTSSLLILAPDSGKRPQHQGSTRTNTANSAVISCSLQWRGKRNTMMSTAWNLR